MSTATNEQTPRKRIRIANEVEIIGTVTSNKKHDYNIYKGPLVSLPPVIRPIADTYFIKLSTLFNNYTNNNLKLQKFDDDHFIPKSCRVNFTAGASNLVKGSTTYSELLAQIDNKNKETASYHRDAVKQVLKLEVEASLTTLRDTFCECLFKLSTMFMSFYLYQKAFTPEQLHKLSKDIVSHEPRIIHYLFDADPIFFRNWYNNKFNITLAMIYAEETTTNTATQRPDTPPAATQDTTQFSDNEDFIMNLLPSGSRDINDYKLSALELGQYEYAEYDTPGAGLDTVLANRRMQFAQTQASTVSLNDLPFSGTAATNASTATSNARPFSTQTEPTQPPPPPKPAQPHYALPAQQRELYSLLMLQITFYSWSNKLNLHAERIKNADLTKLATTLLTSDTTNDVAMTIAAQPPASEAIINDLINAKFNALKKQLLQDSAKKQGPTNNKNKKKDPPPNTTKNKKRGETTTRASNKKKSKTNSAAKPPPTSKSQPSKKSSTSSKSSTPANPRKKQKDRGDRKPATPSAKGNNSKTKRRPPSNKNSTQQRSSGQSKGTRNSRTNANNKP
jgi:hypothetical protein